MIKIIPAIDIIEGKCVRLSRGEFSSKKIYDDDPLNVALKFESEGIKKLHLVDLDGAKAKRIINWNVLEEIARNTDLQIDFGGGLRSDNDVSAAFNCGASQITAGSIAVSDEELVIRWIEKFGPDKIILGADVKKNRIAVDAWQKKTNVDLFSFIKKYQELGIKESIITDISKDGLLKGPSFDIYEKVRAKFPNLILTASGGISNISDIDKLNKLNIDGVIIGKAIYEGKIKLNELKEFLC